MKKKPGHFDQLAEQTRQSVEALRSDPEQYIRALEDLLLEAEDVALYHGDWGLCDSVDNSGGRYQSLFSAQLIDNIRRRRVPDR